ncbi:hypothetical protein K488DRAFT_15340, partial [Vararia minispora EC-137]
GMHVDLSIEPGRCESCIQAKQVRLSISRMQEGPKATRRLKRVYVNLWGRASIYSRSHNEYAMHIVDDYSSALWCILLRSKGD